MTQELQEIIDSLKPKTSAVAKPKSMIDELKETLLSIRDVNPALVDSSKIFEHLLTLVDAAAIVESTNTKMDALTEMIATLETENSCLLKAYDAMQTRFNGLEQAIKQRDDLDFKFKEQASNALRDVSQYLRSHP